MASVNTLRSVTLEGINNNTDSWRYLPGVRMYHASHAIRFHGGTANGWALTFGFELEIEFDHRPMDSEDKARKIRSAMGDVLYDIQQDGSLRNGGFEMIYQPCTLPFLMGKSGKLADLCGLADELGCQSHDAPNAGLHVHVGRKQLGATDDARDLAICKIMYLIDRFYESGDMQKFDRRKGNYQYCQMMHAGLKSDDKKAEFLRKGKEWKDEHSDHYSRYHTLNLTNENTIEFRMFKGTLNLQTLAATLQFVDALVRFCMTHTLQQVQSATFGQVVEMSKYDDLRVYCIRRGITV